MYSEGYPNFHVTFVKDKRIADVTPVKLRDMGFPCDVDNDVRFGDLKKDESEGLIEEFIYLIEELLPRNIQDLFYKVGLEPCDAYWKAFAQAVKRMQLETVEDRFDSRFGQFVDYVPREIVDRVDKGMLLDELYETTCVTKTQIRDAVYLYHQYMSGPPTSDRWALMPIESAAFKLNHKYKIKDSLPGDDRVFNFVLYEGEKPVLAILYYDNGEYLDYTEENIVYKVGNIPVLTVDEDEVHGLEMGPSITTIISRALNGIEATKSHNLVRMNCWKEEEEERNSWLDDLY